MTSSLGILIGSALCVLFSCAPKPTPSEPPNDVDSAAVIKTVRFSVPISATRSDLEKHFTEGQLADECLPFSHEYVKLYSDTIAIPDDSAETLILGEKLKSRGFKVIDYGRGNWEHGPRFIHVMLASAQCTCVVQKAYRTVERDSAGAWTRLHVTERIACGQDDWTYAPALGNTTDTIPIDTAYYHDKRIEGER